MLSAAHFSYQDYTFRQYNPKIEEYIQQSFNDYNELRSMYSNSLSLRDIMVLNLGYDCDLKEEIDIFSVEYSTFSELNDQLMFEQF